MKEGIKIEQFIKSKIGNEVSFSHEDNLFELGLANSLFAMQLVSFLESEFSITVENEDLDLETFSTISNMNQFVQMKLNTIKS